MHAPPRARTARTRTARTQLAPSRMPCTRVRCLADDPLANDVAEVWKADLSRAMETARDWTARFAAA